MSKRQCQEIESRSWGSRCSEGIAGVRQWSGCPLAGRAVLPCLCFWVSGARGVRRQRQCLPAAGQSSMLGSRQCWIMLCSAGLHPGLALESAFPNEPGFPGGSDDKESAYIVGDPGSILELRGSPRGGYGNPLQYSCLENAMDRGDWWVTVHGVAKNQT